MTPGRRPPWPAVLLALALGVAACAPSRDPVRADTALVTVPPPIPTTDRVDTTTSVGDIATTSTSTSTTTTTTAKAFVAPAPGSVAVRAASGVLALWQTFEPDGHMIVSTPCDRRAAITASPVVRGVDVLLDPGHGGLDPGAHAESGMTEAELNLDVALRVAARLRAAGRTVELTRDGDYFRTIADRARLAVAIMPKAFVSIHHNSGIDAPSRAGIGSEIYHQRTDTGSRRLGGLVYDELDRALRGFDVPWTRSGNFGVRSRDNGTGADFYGVLRGSAGVPAILIEGAYMSNVREAAVLATDEFRDAEALAVATAIVRWLTTDDEGSGYQRGFVEPGTGGDTDLTTCRDPDLDR